MTFMLTFEAKAVMLDEPEGLLAFSFLRSFAPACEIENWNLTSYLLLKTRSQFCLWIKWLSHSFTFDSRKAAVISPQLSADRFLLSHLWYIFPLFFVKVLHSAKSVVEGFFGTIHTPWKCYSFWHFWCMPSQNSFGICKGISRKLHT